ncbi:MAG: phosphoribosylpyrophosphate synthetase [Catalinimonas sp.]
MPNNQFETLVQAINNLNQRGYTGQFQFEDGKMSFAHASDKAFEPEELAIVEYHRFEGDSATGDMSVVYAIETEAGEKGTLVDAYGTYSSQELAVFLKEVPNRADD